MAKSKHLIIPVGIPGCGKSTWAKTLNATVVSTDTIRKDVAGSLVEAHQQDMNELIFSVFHGTIFNELKGNVLHDSIVLADATNLTPKARRNLLSIAEAQGAMKHLVVFTNIEDALERNKEREEDAIVPDVVMERMVAQYRQMRSDLIEERELYDSVAMISNFSYSPISERVDTSTEAVSETSALNRFGATTSIFDSD